MPDRSFNPINNGGKLKRNDNARHANRFAQQAREQPVYQTKWHESKTIFAPAF